MDRSVPGRRAFSFAPLDVPAVDLPAEHLRATEPDLPEVAEIDLVRHYTRLSAMNYGVDTGPYPLGSCTMKYNPKAAETVAAMPGFQRTHPLQPDSTMQGTLEMLWRLEEALCEITGMARATLQPPAGACGEMTGLLIMRAYHQDHGGGRTKVLIPDAAHGTNPASVRLAGFEAVGVPSDARGLVDVDALAGLLDDQVAGLMLTNPNTLGLFEERIEQITAMLHDVGALVYYDGANLNAILGRCRPGDMGFDIVHINTHKTFATPHGGGGPGAGPVGVTQRLTDYLPAPIVAKDDDGTFRWDRERPKSIGRLHGFHGNVGVLVRAYAYVFLHGADGLEEVSELAALNANYLAALLAPDFPLAYPDMPPMHEFVATAAPLEKETGIRAMDVAKRADRPRVSPVHGVFPPGGGRGDDGRAHGDRVQGDARRPRHGVPPGRRRIANRPGPAPCGAGDHARPPPGRSEGGAPAEAHLGLRATRLKTPCRQASTIVRSPTASRRIVASWCPIGAGR